MMHALGPRETMPPAPPGLENVQRLWDPAHQHWVAKILPGEFFVTRHDESMTTVLGSCVAACMRDPALRLGGMNHFMLPMDLGGGGGWGGPTGVATRYGTYAMEQLINELMKLGAKRERLEVKLFGGGRILKVATDVGAKNIAFAREFLRQEGLRVLAEDLGDVYPRRVVYFPHTGAAMVKRLPALGAPGVAKQESQYLETLARKRIDDNDDVELFT
jgi:chemotaxis protein CheD